MIDPLAFDTETALIAPGLLAPPLVCVSFAGQDGPARLVHHTGAREPLEAALEGERLLIGHNVPYDFAVVAARLPDLLPAIFDKFARGQVADTMIRQKLIDIASPSRGFKNYSLAECARRWLGITLAKGEDTWRLRYGQLYDVPVEDWPDDARSYALDDASITLRVWQAQEAAQSFNLRDDKRQARAAWWLHLMGAWGLTTDAEAVDRLAADLQRRHDALFGDLVAAGLMRPSGSRDTKAAGARVVAAYAAKGLDHPTTPGGKKPRLDADTCGASGDPLLEAYAEISGLKKRISTDVALLRRGLIQPRFNSLLETGRTSSRPNVQNPPRSGGVRECYVPRPGRVFAAADFSGFELRTVSQFMLTAGIVERSKLADALNAGFDPHLEVARIVERCTYAEAAERHAAGDDVIDRARQVGKVANFGFPGGLGIARFVDFARKGYGVAITEAEAQALKNKWLETWPEFRAFFDWISGQCETGSATIEQAFVQRYRGGASYCEACNTCFQGLAADAAKAAGFLISRACYAEPASPLFGARPVNFVHDEFIVEVDDDERAHDAAFELARLMVEGTKPFLPDVPALAEPLLMRRWSKKAKPVHDAAEGRLIPWDL